MIKKGQIVACGQFCSRIGGGSNALVLFKTLYSYPRVLLRQFFQLAVNRVIHSTAIIDQAQLPMGIGLVDNRMDAATEQIDIGVIDRGNQGYHRFFFELSHLSARIQPLQHALPHIMHQGKLTAAAHLRIGLGIILRVKKRCGTILLLYALLGIVKEGLKEGGVVVQVAVPIVLGIKKAVGSAPFAAPKSR